MDPFDLRFWDGFIDAGGDPSKPAIIDQIAIDSRRIDSKNSLFIPLSGKIVDGHKYIHEASKAGACYSLAKKDWEIDPSISNLTVLRVEEPLKAFQEIAKAYRLKCPCKVIAIAGSYGKTMVKDLLANMLETTYSVAASPESFNSQIGVPLSLLTLKSTHDIALIEAANSLPGEMEILGDIISPTHAIITHIGKKHAATLGTLNDTAKECVKILKASSVIASSIIDWVIAPNDRHLTPFLTDLKSPVYFWNHESDLLPCAFSTGSEIGGKLPYKIKFPTGEEYIGEITTGFYYFLDLINITIKAAWLLNVKPESIALALKNYSPDPMRTEIFKSPLGATFINEPYCSDPQSIEASLNHLVQTALKNRKLFVFGGMRGHHNHLETDYKRIGKSIQRAQIDSLILYGNHNFDSLIQEIKLLGSQAEVHQCQNENEALEYLKKKIKNDDVVLFKGERKLSIDTITETFNDSISSNQCIINLAAISENLTTLRSKLPKKTRIMAIVKALAYGTDNTRMARFLESQDVDILGVSYADEAVSLRRAGITQPIFTISCALYEAAKIAKWNLEVGVSSLALIEELAKAAVLHETKIKIHLHVDTGMGRFGCRPEESLELAKRILSYDSLELEGLMTHFACADDPSHDDFTINQTKIFDSVVNTLKENGISPKWVHASNSSGVMRFNFPQYNMVRIGLAIYGLYPSIAAKKALPLRLAISLITRIVGVNTLKKGESISYGRSYVVQKETQKIAVLPVGYFDGLHRNYSNKGSVIIHGQRAPMVGKICMDFMMIDVSEIASATAGDSVLIFGEDDFDHYLSPEELATTGDSIVHELITCLGPRIQRIFVYEESNRNR